MKKYIHKISKIFKYIFNYFFIFILFLKEQREGVFYTVHSREKYAKNFGLWSDKLKNESKTAIVIQGPIIKKSDFTLETIRIYKKLFRDKIIILSTWEDGDTKEIKKIKQEGVEVILNKKPNFFGQQNINLQIISSFSGIQKAKKMGAEYAIKTRTDQRIYAPNSFNFLENILKTFPLDEKTIQKERIVGVSLNTFKYRPYSLSDMTIYGYVDDLLLYWSPKLDNRIFPNNLSNVTMGEFTDARICEIYLVTEFIKKIGHTPKMTITDSWEVFAKYFCVVDQISLDLYWYKYSRHAEHRRFEYKHILSSRPMTFSEWLNIYTDKKNKFYIPEKILHEPFDFILENTAK